MAASLNSLSFFLLLSFLLSHLSLPSTSFLSRSCENFFEPPCLDALLLFFPFTYSGDPKCGIFHVNCSNDVDRNQFVAGGRSYIIKGVLDEDKTLVIQDAQTADFCHNGRQNLILPYSPFVSFELLSTNYTFLKCDRSQYHNITWGNRSHDIYNYTDCDSSVLYYWPEQPGEISITYGNCSLFTYPINQPFVPENVLKNLSRLLSYGFLVKWRLTPECANCYSNKSICDWDHTAGKIVCLNPGNQMCWFL